MPAWDAGASPALSGTSARPWTGFDGASVGRPEARRAPAMLPARTEQPRSNHASPQGRNRGIDPLLFEGLRNQGKVKMVATEGLMVDLGPDRLGGGEVDMPELPGLAAGGAFSVDFWITLDDLSPGQVILDGRDDAGKGLRVATTSQGTIRIELGDGTNAGFWQCDQDLVKAKTRHHVAIIVDGGPNVISFVVDGILCDGGTASTYGWGRFAPELGDVSGSGKLQIAPTLKGRLERLRVYGRYIRTSEAVANYHAGP
jgi:hypothetical protein